MACRPPYQPQLPQARWGRLVESQRGQTLRGAAATRQAEARRLRVFDFEVFFFGTAIAT